MNKFQGEKKGVGKLKWWEIKLRSLVMRIDEWRLNVW